MKKLLLVFATFIIFVLILFSCKPQEKDKLVVSLSNLSNYLIDKDSISKGSFFTYLRNNLNYTIDEIEKMGFVDASYVLQEIKIIEKEVNTRDDEGVWEIAKSIVPSDFIGTGEDIPKICIFCCTGCLNKEKRDHCITMLIWTLGPGC